MSYIGAFKFVPHALVNEYVALGWEDRGNAPGHHGVWSRVLRWTRADQEPLEPQREDKHRD